jgi:hypothetical protein|tara:strand:- start:195 stop:869 length:675 start_codon:yes stop_codon:yes gene_type:complete
LYSISRDELFEALECSQNIIVSEVKVDPIKYYVVDNVFKNPDKAVAVLKNWPVITPPSYTYTPGGRQYFTPMDLKPLMLFYSDVANYITNKNFNPINFITSSNVVPPEPDVWEGSWHPHTDHDMVFNLWLCDWTEGTGLFTYKDCYADRDYDGTPDQKVNHDKIVKWRNPGTYENDYKHYHTIPCKYNSVAIYDGKLFHGTIMGEGTGDRYSLISFYHQEQSYA